MKFISDSYSYQKNQQGESLNQKFKTLYDERRRTLQGQKEQRDLLIQKERNEREARENRSEKQENTVIKFISDNIIWIGLGLWILAELIGKAFL